MGWLRGVWTWVTVPLDQCVCGLWLGLARDTWHASMARAPCSRAERVDFVCLTACTLSKRRFASSLCVSCGGCTLCIPQRILGSARMQFRTKLHTSRVHKVVHKACSQAFRSPTACTRCSPSLFTIITVCSPRLLFTTRLRHHPFCSPPVVHHSVCSPAKSLCSSCCLHSLCTTTHEGFHKGGRTKATSFMGGCKVWAGSKLTKTLSPVKAISGDEPVPRKSTMEYD